MPYTKENLAEYLEKSNRDYYGKRTWANMFGNVDLSMQLALDNLKTDFGKAAGEAFDVAQKNAAAIGSSNLISGHKDAAMEANQLALQEAYDSYMANYHAGAQTIEENAIKQMSDVNQRLMQQAEMYSKYYGEHFNYLQSLWDKYEAGEIAGDFFKSNEAADYMQNIYDETKNLPLYDEAGNIKQEMKSIGDIESMIYDIDNEGNRTLNAMGIKFFDQLENSQLLKEYSFENYLRENNAELLDWAMSEDPYNWAPNRLGESTMAGTFRQMTGRASDDELFESIENFAGMGEGAMTKYYANINNSITKLRSALDSGVDEDVNSATSEFSKNITELITGLGVEEELLADLEKEGYTYESVEDFINDIVADYKTDSTITDSKVGVGALGTAAFGAAAGTLIAPGLGTVIGAAIGAAGGALGVSAGESQKADEKRATASKTAKQGLDTLITTLADYAKGKEDARLATFAQNEASSGGTIAPYDAGIGIHGSYHNFSTSKGTVTFLSSATLGKGSKVRDVEYKEGDNFNIKFNGETFKLEANSKNVLDDKVVQEISSKVQNSMNRPLQMGDVFYYNNRLWVMTESGVIKQVQQRFGNKDYENLKKLITEGSYSYLGVNRQLDGTKKLPANRLA